MCIVCMFCTLYHYEGDENDDDDDTVTISGLRVLGTTYLGGGGVKLMHLFGFW